VRASQEIPHLFASAILLKMSFSTVILTHNFPCLEAKQIGAGQRPKTALNRKVDIIVKAFADSPARSLDMPTRSFFHHRTLSYTLFGEDIPNP
jgi:hypothetical protein